MAPPTDILPCPFCGSEELHEEDAVNYWLIGCDDCFAEGPHGVDRMEAIVAWNDRAKPERGKDWQ